MYAGAMRLDGPTLGNLEVLATPEGHPQGSLLARIDTCVYPGALCGLVQLATAAVCGPAEGSSLQAERWACSPERGATQLLSTWASAGVSAAGWYSMLLSLGPHMLSAGVHLADNPPGLCPVSYRHQHT